MIEDKRVGVWLASYLTYVSCRFSEPWENIPALRENAGLLKIATHYALWEEAGGAKALESLEIPVSSSVKWRW